MKKKQSIPIGFIPTGGADIVLSIALPGCGDVALDGSRELGFNPLNQFFTTSRLLEALDMIVERRKQAWVMPHGRLTACWPRV